VKGIDSHRKVVLADVLDNAREEHSFAEFTFGRCDASALRDLFARFSGKIAGHFVCWKESRKESKRKRKRKERRKKGMDAQLGNTVKKDSIFCVFQGRGDTVASTYTGCVTGAGVTGGVTGLGGVASTGGEIGVASTGGVIGAG